MIGKLTINLLLKQFGLKISAPQLFNFNEISNIIQCEKDQESLRQSPGHAASQFDSLRSDFTKGPNFTQYTEGRAHSVVCIIISSAMKYYCSVYEDVAQSCSCSLRLKSGRMRRPDAGIMISQLSRDARSSVSSPTCVVEVVFTHPKDLETAHAHCLEYFECAPSVRAVVLIRFSIRDPVDRSFEAIGILYRRGRNGRPYVADAVSFGTAPISIHTLTRKLLRVQRALRFLHLPRCQPEHMPAENPWLALNPYIAVPAVDIFYLRDGAPGAPPVMVQGAPNDAEPLLVDLYETVRSVIPLDPFNDPMESSLNNLP
jgi:hypothetical protein